MGVIGMEYKLLGDPVKKVRVSGLSEVTLWWDRRVSNWNCQEKSSRKTHKIDAR